MTENIQPLYFFSIMQLKQDTSNAKKRRGLAVLAEVLPHNVKKPNIEISGKKASSSSAAEDKSPVKMVLKSPSKGESPLKYQSTPTKSFHPSPVKSISPFIVTPVKTNTPVKRIAHTKDDSEDLDETLPTADQDESEDMVVPEKQQDGVDKGESSSDESDDSSSSGSSSSSSGDFSGSVDEEAEVSKLMATIEQLTASCKVSEKSRLQCLEEKKDLEKRVLALAQEKKELQVKVEDFSHLKKKLTRMSESLTKMEDENRQLNTIFQSIRKLLPTGCCLFPSLPNHIYFLQHSFLKFVDLLFCCQFALHAALTSLI